MNKANTFKGQLNYDLLRRDHQKQVRKINDLYIEAVMSVRGLSELRKEVSKTKSERVHLTAPTSKGKTARISRRREDLLLLMDERIRRREYIQSLVFAVSLTEEYISRNLARVMRAFPQKVLISPAGTPDDGEKTVQVDLRDLIQLGSLKKAISRKAAERTREAMYATPAKYEKYTRSIWGFSFDNGTWENFVEIKATRDLHVHGDGKINEIYLGKVGAKARGAVEEQAVIDAEYLERSISCMKQIYGQIYAGMREKYMSSLQLHDAFGDELDLGY
ncbi:hypothetical protein [Devosia sp. XK-2]|uniref:hypothetical protein n=1 Tax=Devosia sp. XK-2 TaxID=3126689 RepID=UPI0030D108A8